MFIQVIIDKILPHTGLEKSRVDQLIDQLTDYGIELGKKLIIATLIYFVGRWAIRWSRKLIGRFLERRNIEQTVKTFIDSFSNITFKIILFILIVTTLGVSTTSFAAVLAAAGLAIGLAMKDNLSNFAGGIMLLINKPFKAGDRVLVQSMDGVVQSIGILYTILLTADNRTIFIPNGPLSTGNIINFSSQEARRIDIVLSMNFGADVEDVRSTIQTLIDANLQIEKSPEPFIGLTTLNNGTIEIGVRVWVQTADYGSVNVYLNEQIYKTLSQKGIYTRACLNIKMLDKIG